MSIRMQLLKPIVYNLCKISVFIQSHVIKICTCTKNITRYGERDSPYEMNECRKFTYSDQRCVKPYLIKHVE